MTLFLPTPTLHRELATVLDRRRGQLEELLRAEGHVLDQPREVVDQKDLAAEDARATVDDVTRAHAATELGDVLAALGRLQDGSYGTCKACGEAIDERRLRALPASVFCTSCQQAREQPSGVRR